MASLPPRKPLSVRVQLLTPQREDVLSLCMAMLAGKTSTPPADACGCPQDFQAHAVGSQTHALPGTPKEPRAACRCVLGRDPTATMTSPGAGQRWEVSECGRAYRAQFLRCHRAGGWDPSQREWGQDLGYKWQPREAACQVDPGGIGEKYYLLTVCGNLCPGGSPGHGRQIG